jgi:uncharacterized protein YbjT (DUF2867 family)
VRIAVVGGTGVVGRLTVAEAVARGHEGLSLSRASGVDVTTGDGLEAALQGCDAVIDASNVVTLRRSVAMAFFEASSKQLQAAAQRSGVPHVVVLSIVGIDRVRAFGYYDAKLLHERLHLDGPVPATVLRATQFHEFAGQVLKRSAAGPIALVPDLLVRTVAARGVGATLVDVAGTPHNGRLTDLAGPDSPTHLTALARAVVERDGSRRRIVGVPLVGAAGRAVRDGALLPAPDATIVGPAFAEWLDSEDGPARR